MIKIFKILTTLLFLYIVSLLDLSKLYENFLNIEYSYILVAIFLNIPLLFIKSYRWKSMMKLQDINIETKNAFAYYMASLYIGILTPGRMGELSKVFYIKQLTNKSFGWIFSSVFMDRVYDFYFLLTIAFIGFYTYSFQNFYLLFIVLIVFVFSPLFIIKTSFLSRLLNFMTDKLFYKFKENLSSFASSFKEAIVKILNIKILFYSSLLTLFAYMIFFIQIYIIASSIGLNIGIDIVKLSLIMAIVNLISLLPISISGIGTREALLLFFLAPFGFLNEAIILYSLLILLVFYVVGGLMGFYYFMKYPLDLNLLKAKDD